MDDIAEKINALLSDEESMRQIRELAAMFSSGNIGDDASAEDGFQHSGGENFSSDDSTGSEAQANRFQMLLSMRGADHRQEQEFLLLL